VIPGALAKTEIIERRWRSRARNPAKITIPAVKSAAAPTDGNAGRRCTPQTGGKLHSTRYTCIIQNLIADLGLQATLDGCEHGVMLEAGRDTKI